MIADNNACHRNGLVLPRFVGFGETRETVVTLVTAQVATLTTRVRRSRFVDNLPSLAYYQASATVDKYRLAPQSTIAQLKPSVCLSHGDV